MTDWREKYEFLLHKTVKELEESSLEAQRQSELNLEASRDYISELKTQLHRSQERVKLLEERLSRNSSESIIIHDTDPPPLTSETTPISISSDENWSKSDKENREKESYITHSLSKRRKSAIANNDSNISDQLNVKKLEFFEAVTCLNVHVHSSDDKSTEYHCTLDDGDLMGHEFRLVLSYDNWEYTYTPIKPSLSLSTKSQLKDSFFFPDYMLPRFLIKLLDATYKNEHRPFKQ